MSKIAEALAKAKERTGNTTAPFMVDAKPAQEAKLWAYRNNNRRWLVLLTVAALLTGVIIWMQLRQLSVPSPDVVTSPPMEIVTKASETPPTPVAPPAPTPRADLITVVNGLVISAVLPGERPRLMMDGRIIQPEDSVDPELVFAGVRDSHLLFRDARGAIYTRKY